MSDRFHRPLREFAFGAWSPLAARFVAEALVDPDVDPYDVVGAAVSLLELDERLRGADPDAFDDPLVHALLRNCIVPSLVLERLFVQMAERVDPERHRELATSLAMQAELNDGLWSVAAGFSPPGARRAEARRHRGLDVAEFYDAWPFPKWVRLGRRTPLPFAGRDILVAGCGTGRDAIAAALDHPHVRVLGIDVSRRSLDVAEQKAREHGAANVSFVHADILRIGDWDARFDRIDTYGVLHHTADPAEAMRILASLLRPGGVMAIGIYSTLGRRHVSAIRHIAEAVGVDASSASLRAFRQRVPDMGEAGANIAHRFDFFSLTHFRDLLFHPRERTFTIPEVRELIESSGLELIGFDDLPDVDLAAIDAYEQRHPDTFADMYRFRLRKV